MRIAILQTAGETGVVEPNLEHLAQKAAEAAELGVQLLVCPELYLTGYNLEPAIMGRLAEASDGPAAQRVEQIARTNSMAILYGYAENDGGAVYNAAQLMDSDGQPLANYRKSHLYGDLEHRSFSPGNALEVTELNGVPVGILICYDIEFPEPARTLALDGAAVVLVPTALTKPHDFVATTLVPARAWEDQVFVVYADRCGTEGDLDYVGLSTVAGPDGKIVAQAGDSETLLITEIDLDARERARSLFNYLEERRPELYQRKPVSRARSKLKA